jgi:hypothetical protein
MRGAVVFDDEALLRVVEVGSTGERPVLAMKGNLRLGPRQAGARRERTAFCPSTPSSPPGAATTTQPVKPAIVPKLLPEVPGLRPLQHDSEQP